MEWSAWFGGKWAWMAPVMGCFLVFLVVSSAHTSRLACLRAGPITDWTATVASNQSYAAYIVAGFNSGQNSPQREPIEWTNAPRASEGNRRVPELGTNRFIR